MTRSARSGLTRIELLVVIAIIAILIGIFLPATRRVREAAAQLQCQNNLKQLVLACHSFHDASGAKGSTRHLPPGCIGAGTTPEERLSWMVALLPFVEQVSVYKQIDLEKGYAGNLPAVETTVRLFLCAEPKDGETVDPVSHYVAMAGIGLDAARRPAGAPGNGFMGYDRLTSMSMITDGTSNTIALMDTRFDLGPWARGGSSNVRGFDPADVPLHGDQRPLFAHERGMNAAMADGSVHLIRSTIDPMLLANAITIAGGEPVNLD